MPDDNTPIETKAKNDIVKHIRGNWVKWVLGILAVLVVSFAKTWVAGIADEQITSAGGVTQLELSEIKTELVEVKGALSSTNTLSVETNERLDTTVDRLDTLIRIQLERNAQ